MITAKIVADSINAIGRRITTWELEYPLFFHAEFMTHRDFSRNAASARAIPFKTYVERVLDNPALPVRWGGHQKGMQSGEPLTGKILEQVLLYCNHAMQTCAEEAFNAHEFGLHKSITNRWLAPWAHIKVVATATDHGNFFALRAHKDAQPEFQLLAYKMLKEYLNSTPIIKKDGEWHIPYDKLMPFTFSTEEMIKVATARACWASYNAPGKELFDFDDAVRRHDACFTDGHMSPLEHCAQAQSLLPDYPTSNFDTGESLSGWYQYRKMFHAERKYLTDTDMIVMLNNVPDWIKELL